jgi:signal transduction histidine kinase
MKSFRSYGGCVVCLSALISASGVQAGEAPPRSVLILNQSNDYRPWPRAIIGELRSRIATHFQESVSVYTENLDLLRFRAVFEGNRLQDHLQQKYRDKPIGVIAVVGPVALGLALRVRSVLWPGAQIVFAAVDEGTAAQKFPDGVTGVTMQMTLGSMIRIARTIMPDVKRFAVVGDRSEDRIYHLHFEKEMSELSEQFEFVDLIGAPLDDVRARTASLPEHTAILYIGLHDIGSSTHFSADVLPLIAEVANRPIIIDLENLLGTGAVGGLIVSPHVVGRAAADLVIDVLDGQSPSAIPIEAGEAPKPIFDERALQRWNISESKLPPGSEIRFQPSSFWEQHRVQLLIISFAIISQSLLIAWLLFEYRRRQLAEVATRSTMAELAHLNRVATAGVLSAAIAHEVNQPLTGIVASGNAALRWLSAATPEIGRAKTALAQIVDAGHHASDVIQNIRRLVKKETGSVSALDINDVIYDVLMLLQMNLTKYDVGVQLHFAPEVPGVTGNRVQIQQVLLNLMINAIESMSSVKGRVRLLEVKSERLEPGEVVVSIADNGVGMDPDGFKRVFEPMFTTKSRGMGMGLAICRSIVEAHHGRLWATPRDGGGTIFNFALPARKRDSDNGRSD